MIIIDLVGQPCSGKSTLITDLFSSLKREQYNVDCAPEAAKEYVYENNFFMLDNQLFLFTEQLKRIRRLENKVDIIISDTSLLLSLIYSKEKNPHFDDMVLWEYNNLKHLTYYTETIFPYKREGRYQDEEGAKNIDLKVKDMLNQYDIKHKIISAKEGGLEIILQDIKNNL